jgi:hypothetical protein
MSADELGSDALDLQRCLDPDMKQPDYDGCRQADDDAEGEEPPTETTP